MRSFVNAKKRVKDVAKDIFSELGLDNITNLKTLDACKDKVKNVLTEVRDVYIPEIAAQHGENIASEYALVLTKVKDVFVEDKKGSTKFTPYQCYMMSRNDFSNLRKPKAPTNKYKESGTSLHAHIKPVRDKMRELVDNTNRELKAELVELLKTQNGVVAKDQPKTKAKEIKKAKGGLDAARKSFEYLGELEMLEWLNTAPKKEYRPE
tara:strand:- start:85 stop:708 length:624 start_codon:yes stop_codon:yes gene_type:complete